MHVGVVTIILLFTAIEEQSKGTICFTIMMDVSFGNMDWRYCSGRNAKTDFWNTIC